MSGARAGETARLSGPATGSPARPWTPKVWTGMSFSGWVTGVGRECLPDSPAAARDGAPDSYVRDAQLGVWGGAANLLWAKNCAHRNSGAPQSSSWAIGGPGRRLLHELLALDPRGITAPSTYACFAPNHFLLTRRIIPPILSILMPFARGRRTTCPSAGTILKKMNSRCATWASPHPT